MAATQEREEGRGRRGVVYGAWRQDEPEHGRPRADETARGGKGRAAAVGDGGAPYKIMVSATREVYQVVLRGHPQLCTNGTVQKMTIP
jgi:hypothetical protein